MKTIFAICIIVWVIIGAGAIAYRIKGYGTNWCGIAFMTIVPFLPMVAHWCGLI